LVAACRRKVKGLFLLAPAVFLPGFPGTGFAPQTRLVTVVHGWRDEVIPPENSFRLARDMAATLHLVDGDHRLRENIEELKVLFAHFLNCVRQSEEAEQKEK
jgi:predicted esterase